MLKRPLSSQLAARDTACQHAHTLFRALSRWATRDARAQRTCLNLVSVRDAEVRVTFSADQPHRAKVSPLGARRRFLTLIAPEAKDCDGPDASIAAAALGKVGQPLVRSARDLAQPDARGPAESAKR